MKDPVGRIVVFVWKGKKMKVSLCEGGGVIAAASSEALRAAQARHLISNNETLLNGILGVSGARPVLPILSFEGTPKTERGNFRAGAAYFH